MVPARFDSEDPRGQEEAGPPEGRPDGSSPRQSGRGEPVMLNGIDHVGIAVEDLDAAVELYRRTLGLEPAHRDVVESQGVE